MVGIIDSDDNTVWNDVKVGTQRMSDHWNRKAGSTLSLYTYTNADEVELFVNGKSVGVKKNSDNPRTRNKIKWDNVKYEEGYIEAVAKKAGKVVARHKIETTSDAVKLVVAPDNQQWKADGKDLQHIRVWAVDKKGRRVHGAQNELTFAVDGPAEIVGVINGDMTSEELTVGNKRRLYNGTATVILRSTQEAGDVNLLVTTNGLKKVKLKMETNSIE